MRHRMRRNGRMAMASPPPVNFINKAPPPPWFARRKNNDLPAWARDPKYKFGPVPI